MASRAPVCKREIRFVAESPLDSDQTQLLLQRYEQGDPQAFEELFARHRDYLRLVVQLRMTTDLQARIDVSDVIQESHLQALKRLDDYLIRQPMPFKLWLRRTAQECLIRMRRTHVGAQARSVNREVTLPERSSVLLAGQALSGTTPSQHVMKAEMAADVRRAMAELSDNDREILLMRNYEELSNDETAQVLQIESAAARKRYTRAILRLRDALTDGGIVE